VHDGIEMEKLGIPTASIITHVFLNTAKAMTRMMGVPDYEFVVAPHPLSSLTDEECKERAAQIADDIERILLGSNTQRVG
jgi:TctA family transporter